MKNKKNRAKDKKVRQASNFWGNFRRQPRKLAVLLAVMIIAGIGAHLTFNSRAATFVSAAETENGTLNGNSGVQNDSNASGGKFVKFGSTTSGFSAMGIPSYSGSTWTSANLKTDDSFQNLNNWNYGIGGAQSCNPITSCNYYPWWASGTAPYYGGGLSPAHVSNYDVPGNVSQTSTGANNSLFNTYSPQTFSSSDWGMTFTARYNTALQTYNVNGTNDTFHWTSGAINTFNKVYFPTGVNKQFYVQLKAQMMGHGGTNNGAWNAIWLLGQGNGSRELDLQETGICGQSPNLFCSNIQDPSSTIVDYNSGQDLSAGYNIYGIEYNASTGVVNFYLDNHLRGSVTQATSAGPYYLLLDGEIGNGFAGASPPTTNVDMTMNVMQVQVYQR